MVFMILKKKKKIEKSSEKIIKIIKNRQRYY